MNNSKEMTIANLISDYTDKLNQGNAPIIDDFLSNHSDIAAEIRPILESIIKFRRTATCPSLTKVESDAIFAKIQAKMRALSAPTRTATAHPGVIAIDKRPDFLILLLHFMDQIWGNTKLVKLLFLLGKEGHCDQFVPDYYGHYAYNYGAFDKAVPQDVQALVQAGIIKKTVPPSKKRSQNELGLPDKKQVEAIYELTDKGKKFAQSLIKSSQSKDPKILARIQDIVRKHGKKNADELLYYTYNTYPETAEKSKVKNKYLKQTDSDSTKESDGGANA